MILDIERLRAYCINEKIVYSKHFLDRCRERNIQLTEAEFAILNGEIIEEYPDDYPYPSCLILYEDFGHNFIHVVCAQGPECLYMISAYRLSSEKWEPDMKTRKEASSK